MQRKQLADSFAQSMRGIGAGLGQGVGGLQQVAGGQNLQPIALPASIQSALPASAATGPLFGNRGGTDNQQQQLAAILAALGYA